MIAIKEKTKNIIDSMPEDVSYDEILKELAFAKMIEKGIQDSSSGKVISNQEMQDKITQW
ncbi:MAG: hypothetical protein Ctma_0690 [Catillopecten margaritatus gill symbiont]|uniref:Addiction module antitoxin RelB n=1 Tax=Catillopecten margaritatus gill symbiont TaxID=3083288 RepID=A0AAU6PG43_9GAMM